jgi:pimeloyl-ACP methyl ester carboxylesterase
MGQTPAHPAITNSDDILNLLIAFINDLLPDQPFVLGGSSYGGYLARGIADRLPDRVDGLLLMNPLIVADEKKREVPPHVVLARDEAYWATLTPAQRERFDTLMVVQTPPVLERTREEIYVGVDAADWTFLNELQKPENYAFSTEITSSFAKPTLILTGRQDNCTGYRDVWPVLEHYPRATFAVLDRAGHNLPIEQSGLLAALIMEWLDRVEETSPVR